MTGSTNNVMVVLIAAHNEEACIVGTLQSLLAQHRKADRIVVAADNCTDRTFALASAVPGVIAFETEGNTAKKPGALNQAWRQYAKGADLVVSMDADTTLDPTALAEWEREFRENPKLGGCSAKFTMLVADHMSPFERLLVRLQRAEFARWTDLALKRHRKTSVLAGTACCLRNAALRDAIRFRPPGPKGGPWTEGSLVEDFELTYRMRQYGWQTKVSASVRAYTDAMTTLRSLWAQRMKWQTGTVSDLLRFGVNRLTAFDWWQQLQGLVAIVVRLAWIGLLVGAVATGSFQLRPIWLLPPLLFLANDVKASCRIPLRQPADVLVAALLLPQEAFAFLRAGWFAASWVEALTANIFGVGRPDRWEKQAVAENTRRMAS